MHDETLHDDLAALAAHALPEARAAALEQHLTRCAGCRTELASLREALYDALEHGVTPPPERASALRARIMTAAHAARGSQPSGFASVPAAAAVVPFSAGIDWAVVSERGMTLVYWIFTPPACGRVPWEEHEQAQCGYVLEGAMTMHFPDAPDVLVRPGDFYTIAPGTVHGASFLQRTVLLDIYAPSRPEFEHLYRQSARPD